VVPEGCPVDPERHWLVGTVGRMQTVKDQPMLARAFVRLLAQHPALRDRVRLVMVGSGPLLAEVHRIVEEAGLVNHCWLAGERADVAEVMRVLSCFALPSQAEGISNTILEAMASGLPVVATDVGGNAELVEAGRTGLVVAPMNDEAMAGAIARLALDPAAAAAMGRAGRVRAVGQFSLQAMVARYQGIYDQQLRLARRG
jgi:glycosyltransferase involved in cell wall biosynthesis